METINSGLGVGYQMMIMIDNNTKICRNKVKGFETFPIAVNLFSHLAHLVSYLFLHQSSFYGVSMETHLLLLKEF